MPKSTAFARIRAEVIRLVTLIPPGRFTTYGSIAVHMNCNPRHVAYVLGRLTAEESAVLPWHRVVAADARIRSGNSSVPSKKKACRLRGFLSIFHPCAAPASKPLHFYLSHTIIAFPE